MVKVISLSEDAYNLLKILKKPKASFSDTIIENLGKDRIKKTKTFEDLIEFVNQLKPTGKKEDIVSNIDKIVYGVSRDDS